MIMLVTARGMETFFENGHSDIHNTIHRSYKSVNFIIYQTFDQIFDLYELHNLPATSDQIFDWSHFQSVIVAMTEPNQMILCDFVGFQMVHGPDILCPWCTGMLKHGVVKNMKSGYQLRKRKGDK